MVEPVTVPGLPVSVYFTSPEAVEIDFSDAEADIALDAFYGSNDWPPLDGANDDQC